MRTLNKSEWRFAVLFILFDLAVLWGAKHYLSKDPRSAPQSEMSEGEAEALFSMPSAKETRAIDDLERAAGAGSWESVENSRQKLAESFRGGKTKPSRGVALYFFPEFLPETSMESDFAKNSLAPGLAELKSAHEKGQSKACEKAYGALRSRIENYELGATVEPDASGSVVSAEAQRFLRLYGRLTGLPFPYPDAPKSGERSGD